MEVYLESKEDWINFVNGQPVVAYINPIIHYKKILVSPIEIIPTENGTVTIIKKY